MVKTSTISVMESVTWEPCENQIAQVSIPQVATLEELATSDKFSRNEEFIEWCSEQNNYSYQAAGVNRIWPVTKVAESMLFRCFDPSLETVNLYVRNSTVKLFNVLSYGRRRLRKEVLYVSGSQRIGKSIGVFAWLLAQRAEDNNLNFLWVHSTTSGVYHLIDSGGPDGHLRHSSFLGFREGRLFEYIDAIASQYSIICFDGEFDPKELRVLIDLVDDTNESFVIVCSSTQIEHGMSLAFLDEHPMMTLLVDAWTIEDYQQMNQANFFNYLNNGNQLSDEELHSRYYYGGGNMTLFKARRHDAMKWLTDKLDEFGPDKLSILQSILDSGIHSSQAKHILLSIYDGQTVPVSDFIRDELSKLATPDVIRTIRKAYSNHARFQGLITQFEVKVMLRICAKSNHAKRYWGYDYFTMHGRGSRTHFLKVLHYVEYDYLTHLNTITNRSLVSGTVYVPNDALHETFDFVFYKRDDAGIQHFYFVKVSEATTNNINYTVCSTFIYNFAGHFPQQSNRFVFGVPLRHAGYRVHFSYLTIKENYERTTIGHQNNLEDIHKFDSLFAGAKVKYFERLSY